uniref:Uncharacterized protein n=1 Tax=Setaria viridis TaxID=4556 RepID=A0A4U6UHV8_SETVI|nr:hypothetical protein SEVIR_5G213700v2 [Setaria viridis]
MAAHPFDLNLEPPPVLDLNNPIDCNDIPDWDAPAHELDFEGDGVSKAVALKFDVPLRAVLRVWRNGQDYSGIEGVKNKLVKNCGRKEIKIDMEAIKTVPLRERKTIQDLANVLGVKKSTLYSHFKKGYFHRYINEEEALGDAM